jgi:hypothetical protein
MNLTRGELVKILEDEFCNIDENVIHLHNQDMEAGKIEESQHGATVFIRYDVAYLPNVMEQLYLRKICDQRNIEVREETWDGYIDKDLVNDLRNGAKDLSSLADRLQRVYEEVLSS